MGNRLKAQINRQHIIQAASIIDKEGIPALEDSTKHLVEVDGNLYPPKLVCRKANLIVNNKEEWPYSGGKPTNNFLKSLNFKIHPRIETSEANAGEPGYWIFQCNPKVHDIVKHLNEGTQTRWNVRSHKEKIKAGDRGIIWVTGKSSGCYALITVKSAPTSSGYDEKGGKEALHCEIDIDYNLVNSPILKKTIKGEKWFAGFKGGNQGTNYSLSSEQYHAFLALAQGKKATNPPSWHRSDEMIIVGLYLAKFGQDNEMRFGEKSWEEIYSLFYDSLGNGRTLESFRNSLKGVRDTFDSHLAESPRRGWHGPDGSPVELEPRKQKIMEEFGKTTEKSMWEKISHLVSENYENEGGEVPRYPLNQILYGPPGTGKTYETVHRALEIIDGDGLRADRAAAIAKFNQYKTSKQIEVITFHQSYSYEEFIEGIAPDLNKENDEVGYTLKDGVFKSFVKSIDNDNAEKVIPELNKNPTVWRISLGRRNDSETYKNAIDEGYIGIDFDHKESLDEVPELSQMANMLYNQVAKGDLVCVFNSSTSIRAIGVVESDYLFVQGTTLPHRRKVKWLETKEHDIFELNANKRMMTPALHRLNIEATEVLGLLGKDLKLEKTQSAKKYVFIIDEINRGNISKVFGELITLLEEDKRAGGLNAFPLKLPYSQTPFIVPSNLYVIGTMNSSDRSIAMIDMALRRRFYFEEIGPRADKVAESVGGANFQAIFSNLNDKIAVLQGKDYQIGHSYFLKEKISTVSDLKNIWFNNLLPLLNEYFYEDWERLNELVSPFIKAPRAVPGLSDNTIASCKVYKFENSNMSDDEFVKKLKEMEPLSEKSPHLENNGSVDESVVASTEKLLSDVS